MKQNLYFLICGMVVGLMIAGGFYESSRVSKPQAVEFKKPLSQKPHSDMGQTANIKDAGTHEISKVTVVFRGVDLRKTTTIGPDPNHEMAYAVVEAVKQSPFFEKDETKSDPSLEPNENGTFTFGMTIKLKKPVKL